MESWKFHKYIRAKTAGSKYMYTFSGVVGAQKKTLWIKCPLHKNWNLSSTDMKTWSIAVLVTPVPWSQGQAGPRASWPAGQKQFHVQWETLAQQ